MLKPNTAGMESTDIPIRLMIKDFFLFQPNISMLMEIIFSNTAITVESAANDMNIKNSTPHTLPPGIWLNTFGSVINKSDGPLSGLIP